MKRITQFFLCLVLAVSGYGQGVGGNSVPRTVSGISNALDLISSTQGTVFYRGASGWEALTPGTSGQLLSTQGAAANPIWVTATGGAGDVNGPASATDNAIVRFDGTGGKTVQNSPVTIADTTGAMTWATGQSATLTGGDSGASLVLGQGANGGATITPVGNGMFSLSQNSGGTTNLRFLVADTATAATKTGIEFRGLNNVNAAGRNWAIVQNSAAYGDLAFFQSASAGGVPLSGSTIATFSAGGNLLIGTTTDMASTSGGLTVAATGSGATATGVNTGGLRSANFGLSTVSGGASYFGGNINVGGNSSSFGDYSTNNYLRIGAQSAAISGIKLRPTASDVGAYGFTLQYNGATSDFSILRHEFSEAGTAALTIARATGAATFAGNISVNGNSSSFGDYSTNNYLRIGAQSAAISGIKLRPAASDVGAYGFTLQYNGATSDFSILRHEFSEAGTAALTIARATGAATFAGAVSVSGTTATWTSGTGSPESVKTAPVGSLYTRTDGGASTTLYVKESGTGNTGWVAK